MSRWIKEGSVSPLHLALLILPLYYWIYTGHWLALIFFLVFLGLGIKSYFGKRLLGIAVLIFLMGGIFYYRVEQGKQEEADPRVPKAIRILPDTIKVNGDALSFRAKAGSRIFQVFYKLSSEKEQAFYKQLNQGLELTIEGELEAPSPQRNFKGFDYRFYLRTQGIYHLLKVSRILEKKSVSGGDLVEILSIWRRKALVWVYQHFPQPMSHYMTGLLFGFLDIEFEEMSNLYSSLGIIHLFALSGMQVAFFLDAFRRLFLRLGWEQDKVAYLLYPFSLIYAGMTGFSVSVVRSLLQKLLAQNGFKGMDNMGMTFLLLILFIPSSLLTAGGLLSCAYAFILTLTSSEEEGAGVRKMIKETLVLTLGVLPFLAFFFAEYQPWSIPLTFAFSLLFDLVLLPGLSLVFLLSFLFPMVFWNVFFIWMEKGMQWIAGHTSSSWVLGQPDITFLLLIMFLLGCLYEWGNRKKKRLALFLLIGGLCALVKHPLENEITIIDIGQGDSILLRDWQGRTILIDTGGKVEFGQTEAWRKRQSSTNAERTLIPYLKSRGIDQIDHLVLTHTDADHMGDMEVVASSLHIKEVNVSKGSLKKATFVKRLERLKLPVKTVEVGDRFPIFDRFVEVLYPMEVGDGSNNDSLVLYGYLQGVSFLFTGDLEEPGEQILIARYPQLPVDVLKAGHHGSKGSSHPAFLDHIHAKIALVSAGEKNRYQHPHQESLERFKELGMTVFRTDQQGAIRFRGWQKWMIETVR